MADDKTPQQEYQDLSDRAESAPYAPEVSTTPSPPNINEPVTPFGYPTTVEKGNS
jgi:hypothetical protein